MFRVLTGALLLGVPTSAAIAAVLHVHDSSGRLGTVDAETGNVDVIGDMGEVLTDIAFDSSGNLYGVSSNNFYSVDPTTASSTLIGSHGVPGGNALIFGQDGALYSAGNASSDLYTIDPATGASTSLGATGFRSGGDLAFVGDSFYLASTGGALVDINLGDLGASSAVGSFGVGSVFGIATDASGTLFGVGGTSIFPVDTATGSAVDPVDYGGQGLGPAYGQSFYTEAGAPGPDPNVVPLPASGLLLAGALAGLVLRRRGATS